MTQPNLFQLTDALEEFAWNEQLSALDVRSCAAFLVGRFFAKHSMNGHVSFDLLRTANGARQQEWDGDQKIDLAYRAMELGGECGEALNECKKLERERRLIKGSRSSIEKLAQELADVVICCDLLAMTEGIDLGEAVRQKFNLTSDKVGLKTRL